MPSVCRDENRNPVLRPHGCSPDAQGSTKGRRVATQGPAVERVRQARDVDTLHATRECSPASGRGFPEAAGRLTRARRAPVLGARTPCSPAGLGVPAPGAGAVSGWRPCCGVRARAGPTPVPSTQPHENRNADEAPDNRGLFPSVPRRRLPHGGRAHCPQAGAGSASEDSGGAGGTQRRGSRPHPTGRARPVSPSD